ncbi:uncharacterized protein L3040_007037 [Drepanopeziza brunnea f. sp. 'multigermtubi']|uniref:uncharacterized protein n=1 Tax=Drepanopeziza brunnea f. sp. 'multigermtubi' TaxID=698441 RepID=UPI00238F91EB|nr:hypothetical protein L3040_007037 [Drepanopeziza brunnea f. sp. 'multigermtubi']
MHIKTPEDDYTSSSSSSSSSPSSATVPISIRDLPNELLSQICECLDEPPPSTAALHHEPHFGLTRSDNAPLKAVSLVFRRFRAASLPVLYKASRFSVHVPDRPTTQRSILSEQIQPFLDFIISSSLQNSVRSLALLVHDERVTNVPSGQSRINEFYSFWSLLFQVVDPVRLIIAAPPRALGALTSCHVHLKGAWRFDSQCQYICLGRESKAAPSIAQSEPSGIASGLPPIEPYPGDRVARADSSALFDVRNWDTLLLNEGSFIKAYQTNEYNHNWLRTPPSILPDLVGAETENHKAYISPTIRDMSYVGMFPTLRHFSVLVKFLPRVDRLFVQLVPKNDILQDARKMANTEEEDLWMERNSCYAHLMRELFSDSPQSNYQHLQIFESGDAADRDAWLLAVGYVERAGGSWKVAGDGILVRTTEGDESPIFPGSLVRFAWNGTTELPLSASPLYHHSIWP